jgi:hypothetical protein
MAFLEIKHRVIMTHHQETKRPPQQLVATRPHGAHEPSPRLKKTVMALSSEANKVMSSNLGRMRVKLYTSLHKGHQREVKPPDRQQGVNASLHRRNEHGRHLSEVKSLAHQREQGQPRRGVMHLRKLMEMVEVVCMRCLKMQ